MKINNQITDALLAAIAAGTDQDAAMLTAAIAAVKKAAMPVGAVDTYQAAARCLDHRRPRGIGGPEVLPVRAIGADWTWARVQTQGTGNGGRWVATRPLSERARVLRGALMDTLSRLLPGFNVAFLATRSLFWERPILEWMDAISPEMARMLATQPPITSRRQAAALEWKGYPLPRTSIPRTAEAVAMAAKAVRAK